MTTPAPERGKCRLCPAERNLTAKGKMPNHKAPPPNQQEYCLGSRDLPAPPGSSPARP
ncbi:hypothetical protein [Kitasatospora sp. NPDC088783]|uniref:hypothetical protein n=1 Tax=Kitasatospora sp. NPDC088783 TaxID=3364077 RepID=UPI00382BD682